MHTLAHKSSGVTGYRQQWQNVGINCRSTVARSQVKQLGCSVHPTETIVNTHSAPSTSENNSALEFTNSLRRFSCSLQSLAATAGQTLSAWQAWRASLARCANVLTPTYSLCGSVHITCEYCVCCIVQLNALHTKML